MRINFIIILLFLLAFSLTMPAQNVGINSTGASPNASAMLDIVSTSKGLLIPRVALTGTTDATTITNGNVASLVVYNTATAGDVTPGFYYYDAVWKRFGDAIVDLTDGDIFIGNASDVATGRTMSGDVTITNTGVTEVQDNAVDGTDIALGSDANGDLMYYNGTDWTRLAAGTADYNLQANGAAAPTWVDPNGVSWLLEGNSGTTAGTDFLGTTDDKDLVFKVNDTEAMRVLSTEGYLGINKAVPTTLLDVLSDETGDKVAANCVADGDGSSAVVGVLGQALDGDGTDASYGVMGFAEEGSWRSAGIIGIQSDDATADWINYKFTFDGGLGMSSGVTGYSEGSSIGGVISAGAFKNIGTGASGNYGIMVENEAAGARTGVGIYTNGAIAATQYGVKSDVSGGSSINYGYYNEVNGSGTSDSWGEYMEIDGGSDVVGLEQDLDNFSATAYGMKTVIDDGTDIWGIDLDIGSGGVNSGTTRGIQIVAGSSSGDGDTYGISVSARAKTGVKKAYGVYAVGSAGPLESYGVYGKSTLSNAPGVSYGVKGYISGTTGSKIGYAIYGETEAAGSGHYAGYFKTGKVYVDYRLGIQEEDPLGALTIGGASQMIYMNSTSSNMIKFNDQGSGPPVATEAVGRSVGTKIILDPTWKNEANPSNPTDYAIGVDANTLWFGTDESAGTFFKWYGGIDEKMRLVNGNLATSGSALSLGQLNTVADKHSYLDFYAVAGGGLSGRLIRWAGTNGTLDLRNEGSGHMRFFTNSGTLRFQMQFNAFNVSYGHLVPNPDNTYGLGAATNRWTVVYAVNGTIQTSDKRLKTEIKDSNYGLKEVLKLKPVSFYWKSDSLKNKQKIGFIAQDVQSILPELVNVGDDENKSLGMNYGEFAPVLAKAIQEQQKIIEALEKRIEELENK